jgi:glucose/arabinose dehydrogenase
VHPGARLSSRRATSIVLGLVVGLTGGTALTACSGGGSSGASRRTTTTSGTTTTSTSRGAATATSDPNAPEPTGLDVTVRATKIADLAGTTAMAVRTGDDALYVTEQVGRVRAIRAGRVDPTPVLDLTDRVASGGERGLLGLTFSPDGSHLYVDYTNRQGDTRVDEYTMRGGGADPSSRRQLLAIAQPQPNHNGGNVVIGPDGMLWIAMGDGGAGGDQGPGHAPGGNAQSLQTLLGKLLRIDPHPSGTNAYGIPPDNPFANGGGRPEIWAYGLRNPWRFEFDRQTRDLWIGDVGQSAWEEVDFVRAGTGAGSNFGWNRLEGTHRYAGAAPANAVPPVYEYSHDADGGSCAITGGFVYRGTRIAGLRGAYLFIDNCAGRLHALRLRSGHVSVQRALDVHLGSVSSFGQDASGELYLLSQSNGIYRLDPA